MPTLFERNFYGGDLYKILGVSPDATTRDIKLAFRKLHQETHPDVTLKGIQNIDPQIVTALNEKLREINYARDILLDEKKREDYDREGKYVLENNRLREPQRAEQHDENFILLDGKLAELKPFLDRAEELAQEVIEKERERKIASGDDITRINEEIIRLKHEQRAEREKAQAKNDEYAAETKRKAEGQQGQQQEGQQAGQREEKQKSWEDRERERQQRSEEARREQAQRERERREQDRREQERREQEAREREAREQAEREAQRIREQAERLRAEAEARRPAEEALREAQQKRERDLAAERAREQRENDAPWREKPDTRSAWQRLRDWADPETNRRDEEDDRSQREPGQQEGQEPAQSRREPRTDEQVREGMRSRGSAREEANALFKERIREHRARQRASAEGAQQNQEGGQQANAEGNPGTPNGENRG